MFSEPDLSLVNFKSIIKQAKADKKGDKKQRACRRNVRGPKEGFIYLGIEVKAPVFLLLIRSQRT